MLLTKVHKEYGEYYMLGRSMISLSTEAVNVYAKVYGEYRGLRSRFHNSCYKFYIDRYNILYLDEEGNRIILRART